MYDPNANTQSGVAYATPTQAEEAESQRRIPTQPLTKPYHDLPVTGKIPSIHPNPSPSRHKGAIVALSCVMFVVLAVGVFAGWQFSRTGTTSSPMTSIAPFLPATGGDEQAVREAVLTKVRPAIVEVNVTTQQGGAIGSGVIIDSRGYIVTNNHVVDGAQSMTVTLYDGTNLQAQLVGTDPADDLAVIKINPPSKGLTVAHLGDSSKLVVGQDVMAIGNPLGITQTVTNGIVSALNRSVSEGQGGATIPDAIQTDAAINPGNSGGALVDMQGNLIGIPTLTAIDSEFNTPASGVGFAIPSNRVATVVPQIISNGSVNSNG